MIENLTEKEQDIIIFVILSSAAKYDEITVSNKKKLLNKCKKELITETERYKNVNLVKAFSDIILTKKMQLNPIDLKFEYIIYAKALCELLKK
jgi:hypothetical protein